MRLTLSLIKADVGSIGGHTKPSERMLAATRDAVTDAIKKGLLIDGFVSHTGDDIAILMSHTPTLTAGQPSSFAIVLCRHFRCPVSKCSRTAPSAVKGIFLTPQRGR